MAQQRVVRKSKAGVQDLALGKGKVTQTRGGNEYQIDRLDTHVAVDSIEEVQALDVDDFTRARVYTDATTFVDYIYDENATSGVASSEGEGFWQSVYVTPGLTVLELRTLALTVGFTYTTSGYKIAGDGGEANYTVVASGTGTDDGGSLLDMVNGGQLKLVIDHSTVNVNQWGGVGDGATDNLSAIMAMHNSAVGYVRFTAGQYNCSSFEFLKTLKFEEGAKLFAISGATITIRNEIEAGDWFILDNDPAGTYSIGNNTTQGENSREVQASWFGVFPSPDVSLTGDQAPRINDIFSFLGNTRESIVQFQLGRYNVASTITVTRGGWVRGKGQRRTVFAVQADGFDVFTTSNIACRFSAIQFELNLEVITDRPNGAFINIQHDHCDIYEVSTTTARTGINVADVDCRIKNILCTFNGNSDAGSAIINVNNGGNVYIRGVEMSGVTGPESIVNVGADSTSSIAYVNINDIRYTSASRAVTIDATANTVSRVIINNIQCNSFTGTAPDSIIYMTTAGTNNIDFVSIDGISTSTLPTNGIVMQQDSSGSISNILMNNILLPALSGSGLSMTQTLGGITNVECGVCYFNECTTPVFRSGSISNVRINPYYQGQADAVNPSQAYDITLDDNTAISISLERPVFSGLFTLTAGGANYGLFSGRAATGPTVTTITASANVSAVNTVLTGTTGTDGEVTLGVTNETLYVENRLGSAQRISLGVITGQVQ